MFKIILLSTLTILGSFSAETPCRKLNFFGNNIQNKAVLSPVIIVGQLGMNIPSVDEFYKITIVIQSIVKGSLGEWKQKIVVAGMLSKKNATGDLCQFKADSKESRIYFLEVLSAQTGEYGVLFNTEIASKENLDEINKIICINCAEVPRLFITQESTGSTGLQLDCTTESKPAPMVKWVANDGRTDLQFIGMRNGARLQTKLVNNSVNIMYICTGANVVGESTTNVIIRAKEATQMGEVLRCAINDNLLCNGHGKCYKDTIDGGKMFCRCDPGFTGSRCSNNPNKLSSDYIVRTTILDESFCNKNGEGYSNVITKKEYCICKNKYYGEQCSMISESNGRAVGTLNMVITPRDKLELQRMMNAATSKVALHYILIGGAIVIFGCIIVIVIIISMWKCQTRKSRNLRKPKNHDSEFHFGTNSRSDRDSIRLINKYHENNMLPPAVSEARHASPKAPLSTTYDIQLSGNGIYEGVPLQSNH